MFLISKFEQDNCIISIVQNMAESAAICDNLGRPKMTLIEHNNYMRSSADSKLYGFNEITSETYDGYELGTEPYIWLNNGVRYMPLPRIASMADFVISDVVRNILAISPKFVLAGGSVAGLLRNNNFSDYDLFVISDKEEWEIIDKAVSYVKTIWPNDQVCMSKGLLQLTPDIQIILRPIPSIHSLLHGFDLPHCAFAYDGTKIYCTLLSIYCFVRQCILVNVEYNSTTFQKRIYKYLNRCYNIILYQFAEQQPLRITLGNYLQLNILNYNLISSFTIISNYYSASRSAYPFMRSLEGNIPEAAALYYVPERVSTGFEIDPIAPLLLIKLRTFIQYSCETRTLRQLLESLNIRPFEGTKEDLRRMVFNYIFSIGYGHWIRRQSKSVILKLFDYSTIVGIIKNKIKVFDAIDNLYDDFINALDQPANFWITDNPTGQYTMSRTPIEIKANNFYSIIV